MRILHVITGLNVGGAESLLCDLSLQLKSAGFEQRVVSLLGEGPMSARIRANGVECLHFGLRRGCPSLGAAKALAREIRGYQPTVIHAWMYHACVYATVANRLTPLTVPVLWGIHHANLEFSSNTVSTLVTAGVCGLLSHSRNVHIAYCAESSRIAHEARGYCRKRAVFIPNGYAREKFSRCVGSGRRVRAHFNIPDSAIVVGMVARYDPIKDHATFLKAARIAREGNKGLVFLLFGDGIDKSNSALMRLIEQNGLNNSTILCGRSDDMAASYSALDLLVSSSRGEAFPNVICEGMLSEVPCIATDVGDCRTIIGDSGFVVPPGNPVELGQAMSAAAELSDGMRRSLGAAARERIARCYSEEKFLSRYVDAYDALATEGGCGQGLGLP